MPGMTVAADISGSPDVKNLVMGVLERGVSLSNLKSIINTTVQVPRLDATIPVLTQGAVKRDVDELEETDIEGGSFTNVTFALKKDRVKLAVSDEAQYRSMTGDPLEIQKSGAGVKLAAELDYKIVKALETSPQTSASAAHSWDTVTTNPLVNLGLAVARIKPYKADFVIMDSEVWGKYIGLDFVKDVEVRKNPEMDDALTRVPGMNLDIFIDDNLTDHSFMVGASNGMPAVLGNGPVKVRQWDSEHNGATIYQMDVYRQVKAPIFLTDADAPLGAGLNMAAYQVTDLIA